MKILEPFRCWVQVSLNSVVYLNSYSFSSMALDISFTLVIKALICKILVSCDYLSYNAARYSIDKLASTAKQITGLFINDLEDVYGIFMYLF